jgi:hypothetical protein
MAAKKSGGLLKFSHRCLLQMARYWPLQKRVCHSSSVVPKGVSIWLAQVNFISSDYQWSTLSLDHKKPRLYQGVQPLNLSSTFAACARTIGAGWCALNVWKQTPHTLLLPEPPTTLKFGRFRTEHVLRTQADSMHFLEWSIKVALLLPITELRPWE